MTFVCTTCSKMAFSSARLLVLIAFSSIFAPTGCERRNRRNFDFGARKSEPNQEVKLPQMRGFNKKSEGLVSGPMVIVDKKTIYISNLHYDNYVPDAYFWVGNGTKDRISMPDEDGFSRAMHIYSGQNVYLKLPKGAEIDKLNYFGVMSKKYDYVVDFVEIPRDAVVLESSEFTNVTEDGRKILRVPKCCGKDQALDHSGCINWKPFTTFNVTVYDNNLTHINDEPLTGAQFTFEPYLSNIECRNYRYPLFPTIDNVVILSNESMLNIDAKKMLSQGQYCLDFVKDEGEWTTAMLVCGDSLSDLASREMHIAYSIGVIISAIFLIATAIVYYKVAMDIRGKCIIGFSASMTFTFVILAIAQLLKLAETSCNIIGFVFQFFLIHSFTWLTMITIETYRKVKDCNASNRDEEKVFYKYIGSAVSIPLIILIISVIFDKYPNVPYSFFKPKFGYNDCWFVGKNQKLYFFYIPVIIAILINVCIAIVTKKKIMELEKQFHSEETPSCNAMWNWNFERRKLKQMFRACYLVLSIMILCWVAEVATYALNSEHGIIYAIDIIESLQGLFVFIVFVYYNPLNRIDFNKLKPQCFEMI